ncbi:methyltransferase domain-containing protein [Hymenobacter sp. BT559]|uniref:class I SAM-dependent methyltransferase n=1 Tax=Hymenobacter sp. BT559 TaxID=2795729 RepID=UPI0018EB4473|nr:methyltransferase domain-containing protein [Hymenobacter sp. BT559]MBJ6145597.1 methyltransferase domain-containing protein [Hymenobacter sp. BT559]
MEGLGPETTAQLATVPRGNTQKHVNRDVLAYLLRHQAARLAQPVRWLDLPCGQGEFLSQVRRFFAQPQLWGADVRPAPPPVPGGLTGYEAADLSRQFPFEPGPAFDVITSISGIMCFANTAQFVGNCARRLRPGGLLLVSNDNCLSVRDRLSYLFSGRVRRFRLLFEPDEGNFQLVQHQELKRLFDINGIRLTHVVYTARYNEDLLYLPLALLLWPWQWWQLRRTRSSTDWELRQQLFGFKSLLHRHYFFVGEKLAGGTAAE